jgi:hypothetical protein
MTPRYCIVTDPANVNAVAILDRYTTEIVERGIVAEGGRCAYLVARETRDALNRDGHDHTEGTPGLTHS